MVGLMAGRATPGPGCLPDSMGDPASSGRSPIARSSTRVATTVPSGEDSIPLVACVCRAAEGAESWDHFMAKSQISKRFTMYNNVDTCIGDRAARWAYSVCLKSYFSGRHGID